MPSKNVTTASEGIIMPIAINIIPIIAAAIVIAGVRYMFASADQKADIKKGMITYKTDSYGNVHSIIGKVSFDDAKLLENLVYVVNTIVKAKPQTVKGNYIENISISSTMGPGIKLDKNSFEN